jgi:hypothetical protein
MKSTRNHFAKAIRTMLYFVPIFSFPLVARLSTTTQKARLKRCRSYCQPLSLTSASTVMWVLSDGAPAGLDLSLSLSSAYSRAGVSATVIASVPSGPCFACQIEFSWRPASTCPLPRARAVCNLRGSPLRRCGSSLNRRSGHAPLKCEDLTVNAKCGFLL